jgi:ferredoxin/flavodoxin---NADP+ reductase
MAKLLSYNATLLARIDLESGLSVFRVRPDQPVCHAGTETPGFIPGQYVTLGLNRSQDEIDAGATPVSVTRPMSIASSPAQPQDVEFFIRYVEQPASSLPLTHLLWALPVGDRLFLRTSATGHFNLVDTIGTDDPRAKLFVCAGTGLAPFVSIVREVVDNNPQANLSLFAITHGTRTSSALGYREELENLRARNGLGYLPTISRPHQDPDWSGRGGRVENLFSPEAIEQTERDLRIDIRPDKTVVYICGLTGTIAECIRHLLPRGFVPQHRRIRKALEIPEDQETTLYYEQYDSEPVINVNDPAVIEALKASMPRSA